jgi:hypothetical protein
MNKMCVRVYKLENQVKSLRVKSERELERVTDRQKGRIRKRKQKFKVKREQI